VSRHVCILEMTFLSPRLFVDRLLAGKETMIRQIAFVIPVMACAMLAPTVSGLVHAKSVEVVISKEADDLERFAAEELQRYLRRLFGESANVVSSPSATADYLFLLGTDADHLGRALGEEPLPHLNDQGFLLRKTNWKDKPAMLIVGGSPVATMWGVYELVERYGVRYLLHGDVYPQRKQDFYLPEINRVFEPVFRARWFKTMGDFALGTEGWGMADYRPLIDQLAKLRFNRIRVGSSPSQPFLDLQIKGVKRQTATLWYGERFPITADMPGRKLFGNEKEFWNPDLPLPEAGYDKLVAAGQRHCHELIAYAHSRGIEASSVWSVTDFPKDFRSIVPDAQTVQQLGALTVGPGPTVRPDNPVLAEISGTVIRSILDEYADADSYGFPVGTEWNGWIGAYEWAWQELDKQYGINQVVSLQEVLRKAGERRSHDGGERCIREVKGGIAGLCFLARLWSSPEVLPKSRKPNARLVIYEPAEELFPILSRVLPENAELAVVIDYNPTRVLRRRDVLAALPTSQVPTTLVLSLHDDSVGLIPLLTTNSLHELVTDMRKHGLSGFCTRQWMISDHDPSMAYLSKAAWDTTATPRSVYVDQIGAVCGKEAVEPMLEAFRELEAVTVALEDHGMGLAFPWPGMMMQYWTPAPLQKVRPEDGAGYRRALAAVRKAPVPSRPEGKAYIEYWIGRLEFGVRYLDTIEAVKTAAVTEEAAKQARERGDQEEATRKLAEAIQHAEAAQNAAFQAIETFAGVAKNQADRGAVATMAEFVYRPLQRKVEELRAGYKKVP
jgi:glycosyl hydrolase family 67